MQNNDIDFDALYARRLQLQYDQESFLTNARYFEYENDEDENDESFEEMINESTSYVTTPITNNRQDVQQKRENIDNDYAIAVQLQQVLNEEALNENMDDDNPRMNAFGCSRGNFERRVNEATDSHRSHYSEDLNDESDDELNKVTLKVSSIEITSNDLRTVINQFKNKLFQKYPHANRKVIRLSSRNQLLMFSEFIEAIKLFKEVDFIQRPRIEFKNEPVVDGGGAFNDTIRQILDTFMSLENPEYGGNGRLFTGDNSKLISSTAPISVLDELNIFGDILFLAIIHEAPFPVDLDIILFKYYLDLENTITIKDVERFNPVMSNLARNVLNADPDVDLSTIDGFDQWAEDKEISVIKEKQISIEQIKDYFYQESITYEDVVRKLVFTPSHLNRRQNMVKNWLTEWLRAQRKEELQEFCRLVTGFSNPREEITVAFKPYIARENREATLTPRFQTCFSEIKISEHFNSKHEFFAIMNAQVNKSFHDDRFT
ncbi:10467_t:CDS:10, partial [Cetraspora pellucida]